MAAIVGKRTSSETGLTAQRLPKIRNRFRFILMAHPFRWEFDEADFDAGNDGWLPVLGRLNISPGVGGVGDGNVIDLALVSRAKDGWQVLREEDPRLGKYRNYTQRFPASGKASVWGSIWDAVRVIGGRAVWSHDDDGYREFRRFLVDSGIVQPLDEGVREIHEQAAMNRLEAMIGRLAANHRNTGLSQKIKMRQNRVAKMTGEAPRAAASKTASKSSKSSKSSKGAASA